MIPSARIGRGFHRVGVVLGVVSVLFAGLVAVTSSEPKLALLPLAFAAFLYAAARAVGWMLAGFVGTERT